MESARGREIESMRSRRREKKERRREGKKKSGGKNGGQCGSAGRGESELKCSCSLAVERAPALVIAHTVCTHGRIREQKTRAGRRVFAHVLPGVTFFVVHQRNRASMTHVARRKTFARVSSPRVRSRLARSRAKYQSRADLYSGEVIINSAVRRLNRSTLIFESFFFLFELLW